MTQDFAKIKPEPILERKTVETPPAWSLMITGMVVGVAIGVFACVLFYLSGNVPPLTASTATPDRSTVADSITTQAIEAPPEQEPELELEFYTALSDYEVPTNAVPLPFTQQQIQAQAGTEGTGATAAPEVQDEVLKTKFMLQTGAFQQLDLATTEMRRQQILGLDVIIKQQELVGRTLYLVQSGPYTSSRLLSEAEQLLRSNNIPSLRMSLL
ncbi:MAG: hypothetical protein COA96_06575 [SAR86 cluster bacterium]|uniref:SPOR domain-containing protein n=1 Tax=SAR86 cluster bacterium TaxID=2030880 RepID=A0A2A5B4A4_9GAMM|nr:MAG: hypothetical protein COA96_06575 [SAR86 cluster bacterium]